MVRLFDGAIGPTQLAQAQATASLDASQRLKFGMDFAPAEPRAGGFARVTGSVPIRTTGGTGQGSCPYLLFLYKSLFTCKISAWSANTIRQMMHLNKLPLYLSIQSGLSC